MFLLFQVSDALFLMETGAWPLPFTLKPGSEAPAAEGERPHHLGLQLPAPEVPLPFFLCFFLFSSTTEGELSSVESRLFSGETQK